MTFWRAVFHEYSLPINKMSTVAPKSIATCTGSLASAIAVAAEAILTFLGAGLELPAISWGLMLAQARFRGIIAPHLLIPALFLSATVAAFVFLGEGCRRVFEGDD